MSSDMGFLNFFRKKMSGIIALESYVKEIGGGSDSAVPLKCCTKSRAIGFGCAAAPLANYSDNQLVKVSDIETGVYVTSLKVYHHRGTETDNTFDNYEEITEFIHSDMFGRGVPSLYANEFVVEAVYSSGTVENVSHRVTVHRINTGSVAESFQSVELTDGTESVVAYTNPSITHGYEYSFSFGGVTKTIDGWLSVSKNATFTLENARVHYTGIEGNRFEITVFAKTSATELYGQEVPAGRMILGYSFNYSTNQGNVNQGGNNVRPGDGYKVLLGGGGVESKFYDLPPVSNADSTTVVNSYRLEFTVGAGSSNVIVQNTNLVRTIYNVSYTPGSGASSQVFES